MITQDKKETKDLIAEYAALAVRKMKIGEGRETVNEDESSEICLKMSQIRKDLDAGHMTILSRAAELTR